MIKKILLTVGVIFAIFMAYRFYQLKIYIDSIPKKPEKFLDDCEKKPQLCLKTVRIKKGSTYDFRDDKEYSKSAINSPLIKYEPLDTLLIKYSDTDCYEFEVLADSSVVFTDISISSNSTNYDYHDNKPWHRRDRDSYALKTGRAIWAFVPHIYGDSIEVSLTYVIQDRRIVAKFPIIRKK